jgi:hypothetical protein
MDFGCGVASESRAMSHIKQEPMPHPIAIAMDICAVLSAILNELDHDLRCS